MTRAAIVCLFIAPLLVSGALVAAPSQGSQGFAVPEGFEMLMEEQTNVVDVYYGNQFLLSTFATFTPTEIRFLSPDEIVATIPDLLAPEQLAAVLARSLPAHNELLCLRADQSHCGRLEPDVADVIFDEARFRADLFIAPQLLAVRDVALDRYLPPSDAGLGFLQTFSSAISGSRRQSDTVYSINGWSTLSHGESRLRMISNYTSTNRLKIDAVAFEHETRGKQWKLGLFRSRSSNMTFLSEVDLLGARVASSLDTLANLDQSEGNELTLFLPTRSRVDIYKEGRLYSSRIYEIGNQTLNTSELPGGAYDVTLVIRDSFGGIREETRFYVKSSRLPPIGERLYFLDVGEIRERVPDHKLPDGTGIHLLRGGASERIGDHIGVDLGAEITNDERLVELGGTYMMRGGEVQLDAAASERSNYAMRFTARRRIGATSVAATLRKTWVDEGAGGSLIDAQIEQATLTFNTPLGPGRLQLDADINDRAAESNRTYSVTYDFFGWRRGRQVIDLSLQLARHNEDLQFIANFSWRWQEGNWSAAVRPRYQHSRPEYGPTDRDLETAGVFAWNRLRPDSDFRMTLRSLAGSETDSLEYELDHISNVGHGQLNLDYSDRTDGNDLRYGGTFAGSLIADSTGVSIGGRDQSQSALVIDIAGASNEGYFDVMVNGSRQTAAPVGERTILNLRPFETYEIYLRDRGTAYLQYDDQVRRVTLYPGNVMTLQWKVSEVLVVFGQLVDRDGAPVANALLDNLPGLATTDSEGRFQAQMAADQPLIRARTKGNRCDASVGEYRTRGNIGLLGTLTCDQAEDEAR